MSLSTSFMLSLLEPDISLVRMKNEKDGDNDWAL